MTISSFFASHQFDFLRFQHLPAHTCAEFDALVPILPGTRNKNLFLRDKSGKRHILLIVPPNLSVDLERLSQMLETKRLGFASAERLKKYLGVEPGAVSVLSLIHDVANQVELVMDQSLWRAETLQAHPLINTETVVIPHLELDRLLKATGHQALVMKVPAITVLEANRSRTTHSVCASASRL
ncbi:prolyl-tRNA synthetase associated domain-containing protein [Zwartia sp.]|uniref:prolyl-tRNA synthetase associated domain-containing protein n=1 Tax=Zwartia sp. TaxID=2978004 RepID=UPI00271A60C1|nr:prolyl-tRNA synthetase associated domain-containing protein [Zwartia sp.]MDO9025253.1 prolyl-tRNA synthetase associated domain-containing protein [Zwartia sp.]